MSIEFNHTLVHAQDTWAAAREVGRILGLTEPSSYGPFAVLQFDNGTTLDFIEDRGEITAQHYAFLVGDDDFDAIFARLKEEDRQWWADPHKRRPGEINHEDGGRGLYWEGPDGHWLEIIVRTEAEGDRRRSTVSGPVTRRRLRIRTPRTSPRGPGTRGPRAARPRRRLAAPTPRPRADRRARATAGHPE